MLSQSERFSSAGHLNPEHSTGGRLYSALISTRTSSFLAIKQSSTGTVNRTSVCKRAENAARLYANSRVSSGTLQTGRAVSE